MSGACLLVSRREHRGGTLTTRIVVAVLLALLLAAAVWSTSHAEGPSSASPGIAAVTEAATGDAGADPTWVDGMQTGAEACVLGALCGLLVLAFRRGRATRRRPAWRPAARALLRALAPTDAAPRRGVSLVRLSISRT